jgi:AraC family L-rhamnose operon transcriptional activator RhaR
MVNPEQVPEHAEEAAVHLFSERAILRQRDVVASTELWRHGAAQPAHAHEFMEIVLVKSGRAIHRTRSGPWPIRTGSVLLVRPGQWHAYDDPRDFTIWNLYIPQNTLSGELAALRSHPVLAAYTAARGASASTRSAPANTDAAVGPDTDDEERARNEARLAALEPHLRALAVAPGRAGRSLARFGHLLVVLDTLAPSLTPAGLSGRGGEPHSAVLAATELLDGDPARAWALTELAALVHVSASYLCRLFTRELGISPLHYLERLRLERSAQLLLEGDLSVAEISAQSGWSDSNYMARRFRAAYGMSPTRYREVFQRRRVWARDPAVRT